MKTRIRAIAAAVAMMGGMGLFANQVVAGPVIIDGTDAEEHGGLSGGVNVAGWEYFQRGFENLLPQVGNGNKIAVCLGCTGNTQSAFASSFDLAAKPAGWTRATVDTVANITSFFAGTLAGNTLANTGLIYLPTGANTSGGITGAELGVVNTNALQLNTFVGGAGNPATGGGLFAHGEGGTSGAWGWLTTVIPGLLPVESGGGGNLVLTADGTAAFPGLSNADVQGGTPWHNHFGGDLGSLKILVQTTDANPRAVVIGGGAGTILACGDPGQPPCFVPGPSVPEPGTLSLLALGALGLAAFTRRRRSA